jgi:uncharacterized membrane-anchored protein
MNVVNAIAKDDVIKRSLLRETLWQKKDAPKVFSDYFLNKVEDAKKQALIDAENKAKETALEASKSIFRKYAPVVAAKKLFHHRKTTATILLD